MCDQHLTTTNTTLYIHCVY